MWKFICMVNRGVQGVGWGGSGAQGADLGGSEGADMSFEFCLF